MIPEAAVEAALKEWGVGGEVPRNIVTMILEAAAPHMRQAFYLEMNLRAVQDELSATPIYPLGNIEDKRT